MQNLLLLEVFDDDAVSDDNGEANVGVNVDGQIGDEDEMYEHNSCIIISIIVLHYTSSVQFVVR